MISYWPPSVEPHCQPNPLQLRFERQRVKMLLNALDLNAHQDSLWKHAEQQHGVRALLFESFGWRFPTFPWVLVAQSFYNQYLNPQASVARWLRHFEQTYVWKWYTNHLFQQEQYASDEEKTRPLAMVFPLEVKGGWILHNGPPQTGGPKFSCDYRSAGVVHRCWVERYTTWLKAVARSGWTPDAPLEVAREVVSDPAERNGALIHPWMMECCGGIGPDSLVLAWLCRILLCESPGIYERRFLGRDAGHRCVVATHAQIAEELPPHSERQIRSALANLRKLDLIETNQTRIRLVLKTIESAREGHESND